MSAPERRRIPPSAAGSIVASVALIESGRRARDRDAGRTEERVFRRFNDAPDAIGVPVWAVMQAGSLAAVFVVAGLLVRADRPRAASVAALAGTGVWGGVKLVKPWVGRGRPAGVLDGVTIRGRNQTGLGYPSGHAAVALTLGLVAAAGRGRPWRAAAFTFAGAVGGARMYVGAHLPLDVVGGLALGTLCGRVAESMLAVRS